MRLKCLTLHGFKTFADKTDITFHEGVTAIVGPNGSGKSNVVDACLWVLGEQRAAALRAAKAQDIIFAGSTKRRPMNMAEVSLTVDNEDGFLPLDFAEVTVTRRIYRNGDTEFLLNKVPCRLKDITDLFLDTGVGRGAYAIVNQSEIDSILSARAEDRRELFEEAAGVKKYRLRKREAQRKLENTEQNLVRVRDIAREIESQLAPLEAQAKTARQFIALSERLRRVEVGLLARDYAKGKKEFADIQMAVSSAETETLRQRDEALRCERTVLALGERITEAEAEMDRARLLQQTALAEQERTLSRIALSNERRNNAARAVETLERDLAGLQTEQARHTQNATALATTIAEAQGALDASIQALTEAENTVRDTERALAELNRTAAGQESEYLLLARRLAEERAKWDAARARLATREREIAETEAKEGTARAKADTAQNELARLSMQLTEVKHTENDCRRKLTEEAEPAREQATNSLASITAERTTQEKRAAEQGARLAALSEMEAAQEGYFAGVRAVVRAAQTGKLTGRYTVVADALHVPAELDTAVEVALGASLQDIITGSEAEAKAAIAHLNQTRGGRATFLPLDALRDTEIPDTFDEAKRQFSGVLGSAAKLVGHAADVAPAINVLLARVLFVDDLDTATRVAKRLRRDFSRVVTLNGEVVLPSGAMTGGSQARQTANLLGRKREIEELVATLITQNDQLATLRDAEQAAKIGLATARQAVKQAQAQSETARTQVQHAERQHTLAQAEGTRTVQEMQNLGQRLALLYEGRDADREREQALAQSLANSDISDEAALALRGEIARQRTELTTRLSDGQKTVRVASAEVAAIKERLRGREREREQTKEAALRAAIRTEERQRQAADAQSILASEKASEPERQAAEERAKVALAEATALLERWRIQRQKLLSENFQLTEQIKTAERAAQKANEEAQTARVKSAKIEVQQQGITERLMTEYELHPDSALILTQDTPVDALVMQEIGRLRREIKALGAVNPGAIEEFDRLSERTKFLAEQQADLDMARATILSAIAEIDETTRGVFMETFQAVGAAFFRLFVRLFGGGAAELQLTDPDDIFETGVEILAQPPGKKRQNLSLLSGGERALTATALLFAFLEVRPAPFCILDEVDAPLDGANVEKFSDLLRDFGQKSQCILITHNPTTMEAAALWYGVTMQEPGISRGLTMQAEYIRGMRDEG